MIEGSGSNSKRRHFLPYDSLPEGVQNRLDFIFNHLYNLSKTWIENSPAMRDFNVNMRERLTLEMVYAAKHGLPQHVIGRHLNISPNITVKLIDSLHNRFLVRREKNPVNRKENLVFLNACGTDFVKRMLATIDANTEDVLVATRTAMERIGRNDTTGTRNNIEACGDESS